VIGRRSDEPAVVEAPPLRCDDGRLWPLPADTRFEQFPRPEICPVEVAFPCAVCGVATRRDEPGITHRETVGWRNYWPGRVCGACSPVIAISRSSPRWLPVIADLVDPSDPAAQSVAESLQWFSSGYGTNPYTGGTEARFEYVDRDAIDKTVEAVHVDLGPKRHGSGRGCAACGVALSVAWSGSTLTPQSYHVPICGACSDFGSDARGDDWRDALLVRLVGWNPQRWGNKGLAVRNGFRLYMDCAPGGPGVDEPWAYLPEGEVGRLHGAVRREFAPAGG